MKVFLIILLFLMIGLIIFLMIDIARTRSVLNELNHFRDTTKMIEKPQSRYYGTKKDDLR